MRVVETLDVVEQRCAQLASSSPAFGAVGPRQFSFQSGKERFHCGIIVAIAGLSERLVQPEFCEPLGEQQRRISRPAVGVVDDPAVRPAPAAAITRASETSSAVAEVPMDQPKTRRDHKSSTAARNSQPSPVRIWVTSAAQTWSGPQG